MTTKPAGRLIEPRSVFKATAVNHISYGVSDVARTRDFFMDVFGMKCVFDDGVRCSVAFSDPEHAIYVVPSRRPDKSAYVDHLAFSVADFTANVAAASRPGFSLARDVKPSATCARKSVVAQSDRVSDDVSGDNNCHPRNRSSNASRGWFALRLITPRSL